MSAIRERDWWIEFVYTCLKQNARSGTRLHEHGGHPERLRSGEVLHAVLEKRRARGVDARHADDQLERLSRWS